MRTLFLVALLAIGGCHNQKEGDMTDDRAWVEDLTEAEWNERTNVLAEMMWNDPPSKQPVYYNPIKERPYWVRTFGTWVPGMEGKVARVGP